MTETLPRVSLGLDIHPIQVVQDPPDERPEEIPLVRDKATMVRVFVTGNVSDGTVIRDVTATLRTGDGALEEIVADLHFEKKLALVVPRADRLLLDVRGDSAETRRRASWDAYNFEFPNGHGAGTFGTIPRRDPFGVTVDLRRGTDALASAAEEFLLRDFVDTDRNRRRRLSFHLVETADRTVNLRPGTPQGDAALSALARQQLDGLIALFPVPHTQADMVVDLGRVHRLPGTSPAEVSAFLNAFFLAALAEENQVDRFVLVVPGPTADRRSVAGDIYIDAGGRELSDATGLAPRDVRGTVFIVEDPGRFTTAHEDSHQLGLRYGGADKEHDDGPATDGWEVRRSFFAPFRKLVEQPHISYMRGPRSAGAASAHWAAREDYDQLLEKLTASGLGGGRWASFGAAADFEPRAVFVGGHRAADGTIELAPFFTAERAPDDATAGDYAAQAVAANGAVLARHSFALDDESGDALGTFFGFHMALPAMTARLEIVRRGDVLAARDVSPNPPVLEVFTLEDAGNGRRRVTFEAADADGDTPVIAAAYTPDGVRFFPLEIDSTSDDSEFEFDATGLPGGPAGRVRVTATDGVHAVRAFSPAAEFPGHAPVVSIASPIDGGVAAAQSPLTLRGTAYDLEDGVVPGTALTWRSDLDGPLGAGEQALVSGLSAGTHVVSLSAVDSDGTDAEATHALIVLPQADTPDLAMTGLVVAEPPAWPCRDATLVVRLALAGKDAAARLSLSQAGSDSKQRHLLERQVILSGNEESEVPLTVHIKGKRGRQISLIARADLLDVAEPNTGNNGASVELELPDRPVDDGDRKSPPPRCK